MTRRQVAGIVGAVWIAVFLAQAWLVARCATDIPWYDQWGAEGRELYPRWIEGTWHVDELFRAHNGHRIAWTRGLDLGLLAVNGQWDPLVQMVAGAVLRATAAAFLVGWIVRVTQVRTSTGGAIAAMVAMAFVPQLAWHNALWGFQSQVYFSLLFSLVALALLGGTPSPARQVGGLLAGGAGLFAMGASELVPVALVGLAALRSWTRRKFDATSWREAWPALLLLGLAAAAHARPNEPQPLRAHDAGEFLAACARVFSWPHVTGGFAAAVMIAPWIWLIIRRIRRTAPVRAEDQALLLGGWALAIAAAIAWERGGGDELVTGVPSRYVDFVVLVPIANAWCAASAWCDPGERARGLRRWLVGAWVVFVMIGWVGLSAQMWRGVILPRARDREAPVRLMQAFQKTGNAAVFAGQPRLLVPSPDIDSIRDVLADGRLRGKLPPSLQPGYPMGPLSRIVRVVLGRGTVAESPGH